jgi:LmbE family N-acetylglucosaminyl deacetylase
MGKAPGMPGLPWPPRSVVVLSPHLDDGVMSCGELIGGCDDSVVVTVFTGSRPPDVPATEWDRAAGFDEQTDVVAARRDEDRAALDLLGARPLWLGFVESQYGATTRSVDVATAFEAALDQHADAVAVIPLGLWHDEHRLVHEAALAVVARRPDRLFVAYADVPYRRYDGASHLSARLEDLAGCGVVACPVRPAGNFGRDSLERKIRAVGCYESQLRALYTPGRPGVLDAFEAEQYWTLDAANRGG